MLFDTVLLFQVLSVVIGLQTEMDSLSFDLDTAVKRKVPGLNVPPKLWWAKEITKDFHIAGRLTERQIKYASEAGFRSIFSLFMYETEDAGSFGGEHLPTSAEAWAVAHLAGLQYVALIESNDDWASIETIKKYGEVLPTLRRPILLHCDRGYTITFVVLMHMANQTRYNSSFEPKIYSENFYRITAAMGLDFTHDDLKEVVANITGEIVVLDPPKPNCNPDEWLDFWLAHPVFGNWYIGGQIRKCDVKVLEATGFKSVVNMRLGVTHENKPYQEDVTLLNVKDTLLTYGNDTGVPRQDLYFLEKNTINPHLSSDYISAASKVNYEIENPDEFGDDIGYNETMEREFFKNSSLHYYHIPISNKYSSALFKEIQDILLKAGQQGPVLIHCRANYRAAYFTVLAVAVHEGLSREWALKRIQELGLEVSPTVKPEVYKMYCECLKSQSDVTIHKEEL